MTQAIKTTRSERGYTATCYGARCFYPHNYALDSDENHL